MNNQHKTPNEVNQHHNPPQHDVSPQTERHSDSSWTVIWLILTLIAAFGVAGAYLEKRLESLEEKVVAQTGDISQQAFEQSKIMQKEILTNRAESAAIATSMSDLMADVSQMMNVSVQSFSAQTQQLASAVEAKEKNQSDLLKSKLEKLGILTEEQSSGIQAAIETLAKEVADTKTIVIESQQQSNKLDVHIAKLTKQLDSIESNLQTGLVSLTDLVETQNELIMAQFAIRSDDLSTSLAAIRETSAKSYDEVSTQITALNNSQSQTTKEVHQSIADSAQTLTNSITGIQNRLTDLSDTVEVSQAGNDFNAEVIQSELTGIRNTLDIRTSDLLVESGELHKSIARLDGNTPSEVQAQLQELAALFENANVKVTESQITSIQAQFESLSEELTQLETGINSKLDTVTNRIEEARLAQNDASQQELLNHLKTITEDVGVFPKNISDGLVKAQTILKDLNENPSSAETIQALDSILQELSVSVQTTQEQVDTIKDKISNLTEKLTEITRAPIMEEITNYSHPWITDAVVSEKTYSESVHIDAEIK